MSVESAAARAEPACPNCGYSRKGLAGEGAACPECGAAPPSGSDAWLRTMRSSMTILCWAIPMMLLAWASPSIFVVGREGGTMPLVAGSSWLMLAPAAVIAFALTTMVRCIPPSRATRWCPRLAALALTALASEAAGASDRIVSIVIAIKDTAYPWAYQVWAPVLWLCLAVGSVSAGFTMARAVRACGLPRAAARVRWVTVAGPIAIAVLSVLTQQSDWLRPQDRPAPFSPTGSSSPPGELARDIFDIGYSLADFLLPLLIVAVALVTWHAAALARRHIPGAPYVGRPTVP